MTDFKKIFTNWRIIILIVALILAIISISPQPWIKGAAIRSVEKGSAADLGGIPQPSQQTRPVDRERIIAINNRPINNVDDYVKETSGLDYNRTITVKTNKAVYRVVTQPEYQITTLNETEQVIETDYRLVNVTVNGTTTQINQSYNVTITRPKTESTIIGTKDIGLKVFDAPQDNIRTGLDLQGGTRVLLKPEVKLNSDDLQTLIMNMKQRLNVYGLSDLTVRDATDLSGNQFILVEIAGVSEDEVQGLLAKQGKFEAKINNQTVFVGGRDITYVCRSAECSGIDPQAGCAAQGDLTYCRFRFSIALTQDAAKRQADMTNKLDVIPGSSSQSSYLSAPLDLYLDDQLVDSLNIGAELKGSETTQISISGSGKGNSQREALDDALSEMHRLQTVLITGSLPIKLTIIKTDSISSALGSTFAKNALMISVMSILAVIIILFIVYRKLIIAVPIFVAMICEIIIVLGAAAFIGWNIDLAAVAGIIAAVGTGVDDQIVITDEALRGKKASFKDKLKEAFFIIFGSYLTVVVAMAPLIFAGAGLLKGFAITTIIGVSVGVFITRPAYAALIEMLLEK